MEHGVYGDLFTTYPKPYSTYLRGYRFCPEDAGDKRLAAEKFVQPPLGWAQGSRFSSLPGWCFGQNPEVFGARLHV